MERVYGTSEQIWPLGFCRYLHYRYIRTYLYVGGTYVLPNQGGIMTMSEEPLLDGLMV